MVGRLQDDKLSIFGSGTCPRWEPELKALNEKSGFKIAFKPEGFGPSDHSSFYGKKIPVLHFFTNNHPDYHRPTDDWEKINLDGMVRVIDMLEQMIVQTMHNPERPAYVEVKQPQGGNRGGNRPYLGSIPDFGSDLPGYSISGAAPGSPAERGGLKAGDRIVSLGGNKVTGLDDFDLALRKFKAGDEVAVIVIRDGQEVPLKITLDPPR
jgi:membrane-associated protease RseP (regulator of RpoE activity)